MSISGYMLLVPSPTSACRHYINTNNCVILFPLAMRCAVQLHTIPLLVIRLVNSSVLWIYSLAQLKGKLRNQLMVYLGWSHDADRVIYLLYTLQERENTHLRGELGTDWAALSLATMVSMCSDVSLRNTNLPVPASSRTMSGVNHLQRTGTRL